MESTAAINPAQNQLLSSVEADLKNSHEYIYSIDFSMIINKLITRHKWLKIEAEEACKQYRNYLWVLKRYGVGNNLPPSEDIDEFWHQHVLDTRSYHQDCFKIFGKYLHHYPYLGVDEKTNMDDLKNYFNKTQQLYLKEFGCPITAVRFHGSIKYLVRMLLLVQSFFKYLKPKKQIKC